MKWKGIMPKLSEEQRAWCEEQERVIMYGHMKPKYEYMVNTWGGFYNDQHKNKHHQEPGYRWFETKEERHLYITSLETISEQLNAKMLMYTFEEGYHTRIKTVLHRVIYYKGKEYYSENDLGFGFPMDGAEYIMEWKWTPGGNDCVAFEGEDEKYETIAEWITGAKVIV